MLDTNRSVGALAAEHPRLRAVLEELGIDYCCSGNRNLADAAAAEGLPIQRVMAEIARSPEAAGSRGAGWVDKPLAQIIDHIAGRHRAVSLESLARGAVLFELIAEAKLLGPERLRAGRALLACIDNPLCRRLAAHLQEVERDLHEAMNLENFVLYPRGIELEDQLLSAPVPLHA